MQIINLIFLLSESVLSIPQATCPIAACTLYALNSYTKKTRCLGGCILEYNLGGSVATCNSAVSTRLTSKIIKC